MKTATVGQFLLTLLHSYEVEHIYGVSGDAITGIRKNLEKFRKIRHVMCAHESTAAFSAEVYGRVKRLGAMYVTYNAGMNNALNGIDEGYLHNSALVVIGGEPSMEFREKDPCLHHHQLHRSDFKDQMGLLAIKLGNERTRSITDLSTAAEDIAEMIGKAIKDRLPVYLGIPSDMWEKEIAYDENRIEDIRFFYDNDVEEERLFRNISLILKKTFSEMNRPLISVGHEVKEFGLFQTVIKLAEKLNVPVVARFNGHGTFPISHPLFVGTYNGPASVPPNIREFTEKADRIDIGVLETDLNFALQTETVKLPRATIVFDPRAEQVSIGTTCQVRCNKKTQFLLLEHLAEKCLSRDTQTFTPFSAWADERSAVYEKKSKTELIAVSDIAPILNNFLKGKDLPVLCDVGDPMLIMLDIVSFPSQMIYTSIFAAMGVFAGCIGLEHATGKRALVLVGDGAFCIGEIYSLALTGAAPIIVILNNGGWRMMRKFGGENKETEKEKGYDSLVWPTINFPSNRIACTPETFAKALENAFQKNVPYVIDLRLDPDDETESLKNFKDVKR
jgi:indolepyruvate decarboxylase